MSVTFDTASLFWASCRIRTNDPEITNHVLWPTELKRRVGKLFISRRYNLIPLLCSHPGGFSRSWPYETYPYWLISKEKNIAYLQLFPKASAKVMVFIETMARLQQKHGSFNIFLEHWRSLHITKPTLPSVNLFDESWNWFLLWNVIINHEHTD